MDSIIPREWVVTASEQSLEGFALKRLNHAQNLEKEARAIQDEAGRLKVAAGIAQWLAHNRSEVLELLRMLAPDLRDAQLGSHVLQDAHVGEVREKPSVLNGVVDRRRGNAA